MAHLFTLITAALKPACWICALSVLIAIIPSHYILSNVDEPSWSWIISSDHIQVQKNLLLISFWRWKKKFSLIPFVYNLMIGYAKKKIEKIIRANAVKYKKKKKKPRLIAISGLRTTSPG